MTTTSIAYLMDRGYYDWQMNGGLVHVLNPQDKLIDAHYAGEYESLPTNEAYTRQFRMYQDDYVMHVWNRVQVEQYQSS